ncbi:MAG: hypothetical protein MI861_28430 [Pirellulales bacterium]|nr:hypothetical protein [Pirellulales bacterium]
MNTPPQIRLWSAALAAATFWLTSHCEAANPATIAEGKQLFEHRWPVGNPALGSDGLGPLFNGQSCLTCHHQAGMGGSGDSRFNANTIGIYQMKVLGKGVDPDVVSQMVRSFHPGFVRSLGKVSNTLPMQHHGGSPQYVQAKKVMLARIPARFSKEGGTLDANETRLANAAPILFHNTIGGYQLTLQARLFQRNTMPLFGLGLLDQVSAKELEAVQRAQKSHPEISGRPSVLADGRYGKFGWRANIASLLEFTDQACAREMGLETRRKNQPRDPMTPDYRNPAVDISDDRIVTLHHFVASLPPPRQILPEDSEDQQRVLHGQRVFNSVGCAVCHLPNLGPAQGVYSDLLLHDMGSDSIDLNHAEPYRIRVTPVRLAQTDTITTTTVDKRTTGYYGGDSTMKTQSLSSSGSLEDFAEYPPGPISRSRVLSTRIRTARARAARLRHPRVNTHFTYVAPSYPPKVKVIDLAMNRTDWKLVDSGQSTQQVKDIFTMGMRVGTRTTTKEKQQRVTTRDLIRVFYEPTRFNQEWRTPPLWGLRDSAPYMHDGRADTVLEAIAMHGGEAAGTRDRFLTLPLADRYAVLAFLETLAAPRNVPQAGK